MRNERKQQNRIPQQINDDTKHPATLHIINPKTVRNTGRKEGSERIGNPC